MYDLSILIPARNEMFAAQTVEHLLQQIRGNTEILVHLDGAWANPGIPDDPRVTIVYSPEAIGQRAGTNKICKLSKAKYVMKMDAHTAVAEGFDTIMIASMEDNYTVVPLMRNLHGFDWVCIGNSQRDKTPYITPDRRLEKDKVTEGCGNRTYQGPTPAKCDKCGGTVERELLWIGKDSPKSTAFQFDKTLHFQYWNDFKRRPEGQGDLTPTLTIQGSCFMLTRAKYWELNVCDEEFGSWGQQGVEVALKTWLSGGKVLCNQQTWYAHMFRTQGGDFGFPYKQSDSQLQHARELSRELFINDKWPQAIRTFQSVLDQFAPIPKWNEIQRDAKPKKLTKEIVYYTHNVGDKLILDACKKQILKGMKSKHIINVSSLPIEGFGKNIVVPRLEVNGFFDMFQKILIGLKASTADIIFFCEQDVLYHPSHFDFIPPEKNKYYYNTNVWRVRYPDGHGLYTNDLKQLSGLVAYRETLIKHYEERIKRILKEGYNSAQGFEPGTHNRDERIDDLKADSYQSAYPNIDIRHSTNSTPSRWNKEEFRNKKYTEGWTKSSNIPGWGELKDSFTKLLESI